MGRGRRGAQISSIYNDEVPVTVADNISHNLSVQINNIVQLTHGLYVQSGYFFNFVERIDDFYMAVWTDRLIQQLEANGQRAK